MQEQPPSDQPRREPAAQGRRSRSPRPTFTPPPTPEPAPVEVADGTPPRPRRAKAAPSVLFQPPDPVQPTPSAAGAPATPGPRPPAEIATTTDPGTPAAAPPPATAPADEPVIEEPPKRARRAPAAKKATPPKKATPAARKPTTAPEAPAARKPTTATQAPTARKPTTATQAPAAQKPTTATQAPTTRKPTTATQAPAARKPRTAPEAPAALGTTAPAGTEAAGTVGPEPGSAEPAAPAAETVTAARTGRTRKSTRAAPADKTAPAKRASAAQVGPPDPQAEVEAAATGSAARSAVAGEVVPAPAAHVGRPVEAQDWRAVGVRVLEHPGFAPELLALAAVDALGPRAADWVQRTRDAYPDADADGLARLVTRRFVRLAGTGGALAAGAGLFAPVAELTAVLWTQANLVLHLAAVYGRDPAHPDRVVELLVLTQVHPDAGTARAALDGVRSAGAPAEGSLSRAAEAAWRLATPLAAQAAGWLGLRLAARLLPGAAALAAATGDATAAERLAARATSLYRPPRR
ncbi:hypothetical protein [Micromonospora sp. CA-244673]|uniref:hypothetical protein n=1 Tax=Micromonospora sp. CA-244673 TaxID=3239958 RepID=UPI003D8A8DC7